MTPDGDLVARMVAKDGAALDELWARHSRTAYAVAIGILRESGRADQAVSQAFLEAFSLANQFVPGELTVLAWLTRNDSLRARFVTLYFSTLVSQDPDTWGGLADLTREPVGKER